MNPTTTRSPAASRCWEPGYSIEIVEGPRQSDAVPVALIIVVYTGLVLLAGAVLTTLFLEKL